MANITEKEIIYKWFEFDAIPTEEQFRATWDSFWHKSESLPMSSIAGLTNRFNQTVTKTAFENHTNDDEAHNLVLAKRDASNLSIQNVAAWKTKLGVGELPKNIATIDYIDGQGNAIEGNAYKKVVNPNDGNTYVLNIDGSAVNANTFGKNVTNSSNSTTGSHTQTQEVGHTFTWETNGQSYALKSLPDKSVDASFTDLVGKNSQGQLAKVGFPAFLGNIKDWTDEQKLQYSLLLGSGKGSAGFANVTTISPPIIQSQYDGLETVFLFGVNLAMNPNDMAIELWSTDKTQLLFVIPNSNIDITDRTGGSVNFKHNFHNFPVREYYVATVNNGARIIHTQIFKVVDFVENIDLSAITWSKLYDASITANESDYAGGANTQMTINAGTSTPNQLISFISSELFSQGEDFLIEISVTITTQAAFSEINNKSYIGLTYSNTENALVPISIINMSHFKTWSGTIGINNNSIRAYYEIDTPYTILVKFIKTGNLFRTIVGSNSTSTALTNNSGYSMVNSLSGRDTETAVSTQISKAFKFK